VEERAEGAWVNLHDMLVPLPPTPSSNNDGSSSEAGLGFRFLWASERSGYRQLYLYEYQPGAKGTGTGTDTGTGTGQGATCLLDGQPVGGGGPWIVERYKTSSCEANETCSLTPLHPLLPPPRTDDAFTTLSDRSLSLRPPLFVPPQASKRSTPPTASYTSAATGATTPNDTSSPPLSPRPPLPQPLPRSHG